MFLCEEQFLEYETGRVPGCWGLRRSTRFWTEVCLLAITCTYVTVVGLSGYGNGVERDVGGLGD